MTLLVTGASGFTGGEVCRQALAAGLPVVGTFHREPGDLAGVRWARLDVTDRAAVAALVAKVRPSAVLHLAYRTGDWAVTAEGSAAVAAAAAAVGCRLVHVSSDAVFAGRAQPYTEADRPDPVFPYGAAKAAAEVAVAALAPRAVIVRTSLIVGDDRSPQHRLCLDLATGRSDGVLFTDDVRCPVAVTDLVAALLELVGNDVSGVLHVAGPEAVSRHGLGVLVAARHGLPAHAVPAGTIAGAGLHRPAEVRLDSSLAARLLRTRLRGVREVLAG